MMETVRRSGELHDFHLASRKAEESGLRRYQAVHWLESFVGPIGIHSEPSEKEFLSCLRNGIILCNVINKIQPGRIPKVVDNNEPIASELSIWDSKPLPAYQYFENVRNFLMAVKELKLPAFEASDLQRENFEAEAATRVADCILALKSYHEWKECNGGNGVYKHMTIKSPLVLQSSANKFCRSLNSNSARPCRRLDMSPVDEKQSLIDSVVKALTNHVVDSKENINNNFLSSFQNGNQGSLQLFTEILSSCLKEKLRDQSPMLKSCSQDNLEALGSCAPVSVLKENLSLQNKQEHDRAQNRKGSRDHWRMLRSKERDLSDIKNLWYKTKTEFEDLQSQMLNDMMHIGSLVEEMSTPVLGYQKVVQENRKLYNLAQDLKGRVRVYCRIRPILNAEARNVVDFVGQDGSLVVVDPSKPRAEGRKVFQFNKVYGPTSTEDEVFKEIQPLIRSVMDGYNVCILAYDQIGSGKTHTMYESSGVSEKEMDINFFALNDLFQTAEKRPDVNYEVQLQMVRIYNEQIQDLLVEDPSFDGKSSLSDVTFHSVKSYVDAINMVKLGERKHAFKMNNLTSHSHSAITIQVRGKDTAGSNFHGSLYLVDLAASEEDNESLFCLEDLIKSFSQKKVNINSSNSKITLLLQDALGGNAKVVVFAHVNPEGENFTETINTLRFTQKISTIELGAEQSNKKSIEVMNLKQEIELLKRALDDKDERNSQPNRQLRSPCDKARPILDKSPVKERRLSIENPGSMRAKSPFRKPKPTDNDNARTTDKLSDGTTDMSVDPIKSPKPILERSFPRSRRLSLEQPGSMKREKLAKSPVSKQKPTETASARKTGISKYTPKSPCEKPMLEGSFPRPRRLSIENPMIERSEKKQKLKEQTPHEEGKIMQKTPPKNTPIAGTTGRSKDTAKSPGEKPMPEGSFPRLRRMSIENPMIARSEKKQKLKEHKSPEEGKIMQKTPPKTHQLSIENPNFMKPTVDISESSKTPPTSLHARRLNLGGPKNFSEEQIRLTDTVASSMDYISIMEFSKSPSAADYINGPTFIDCATNFPSFQQPKTPEQQKADSNDLQTPGIAKSKNRKGSQIKKSLRTIGKLLNGSEKRNQHKVETSSMKAKGKAHEPKSPPTAKARAMRRSTTSLPIQSGPNDSKNARTPPSMRSSTKITGGRWM